MKEEYYSKEISGIIVEKINVKWPEKKKSKCPTWKQSD